MHNFFIVIDAGDILFVEVLPDDTKLRELYSTHIHNFPNERFRKAADGLILVDVSPLYQCVADILPVG